MRGSLIAEAQRARERLDHLRRRMLVPTLLQSYVIVRGDSGEPCKLLASQPGYPAAPEIRQTDIVGTDLLAPCAQELADPVL